MSKTNAFKKSLLFKVLSRRRSEYNCLSMDPRIPVFNALEYFIVFGLKYLEITINYQFNQLVQFCHNFIQDNGRQAVVPFSIQSERRYINQNINYWRGEIRTRMESLDEQNRLFFGPIVERMAAFDTNQPHFGRNPVLPYDAPIVGEYESENSSTESSRDMS